MTPRLVVSLHDLHPGSRERIAAQREALASWGVARRSLLVVPEFHHGPASDGAEAAAWVRRWQEEGDEVVLHGFYHDRLGREDRLANLFWTRFYTNGEAEFLDLPGAEARRRLEEGKRRFAEAGFAVKGFIAPAWLMAPGLTGLLAELGFAHTTTLRQFLNLATGTATDAQSLCWSTRADWRRGASLAWNHFLCARLLRERGPLLRISLHPDDLRHAAIRQQIERCVKSALDAGYKPVTYADYAAG